MADAVIFLKIYDLLPSPSKKKNKKNNLQVFLGDREMGKATALFYPNKRRIHQNVILPQIVLY